MSYFDNAYILEWLVVLRESHGDSLLVAFNNIKHRRDLEKPKMVNILTCLVLCLTCLYSAAEIPQLRWRPGRCPDLSYRCTMLKCNMWCLSLQYRLGICIPISVPCNIFVSVQHNQCICVGPPASATEAPATNKVSAALATSTPQTVTSTSRLSPPEQSSPQATEIERMLTPDATILLGSTMQTFASVETSSVTQVLSTAASSTEGPPKWIIPSIVIATESNLLKASTTQAEMERSSESQSIIEGYTATYSTLKSSAQQTPSLQASSTSLVLLEASVTPTVYGTVSATITISTLTSSAVTGIVTV